MDKFLPYIHFLVGFILSIFVLMYTRNKKSPHSPERFSLKFLVIDNYRRWGISLPMGAIILYIMITTGSLDFISIKISHLMGSDASKETVKLIFPFVIGFSPDFALGLINKLFGFFNPNRVLGYARKPKEKNKAPMDVEPGNTDEE